MYWSKRSPSNNTDLSLGGDSEAVNNDAQEADVFNKCFCSHFGMKHDDISCEADRILSNPLVTKEDIRQHVHGHKCF